MVSFGPWIQLADVYVNTLVDQWVGLETWSGKASFAAASAPPSDTPLAQKSTTESEPNYVQDANLKHAVLTQAGASYERDSTAGVITHTLALEMSVMRLSVGAIYTLPTPALPAGASGWQVDPSDPGGLHGPVEMRLGKLNPAGTAFVQTNTWDALSASATRQGPTITFTGWRGSPFGSAALTALNLGLFRITDLGSAAPAGAAIPYGRQPGKTNRFTVAALATNTGASLTAGGTPLMIFDNALTADVDTFLFDPIFALNDVQTRARNYTIPWPSVMIADGTDFIALHFACSATAIEPSAIDPMDSIRKDGWIADSPFAQFWQWYRPPRFRFIYPSQPPLRWRQRDDGLGLNGGRRARGASSLQKSLRGRSYRFEPSHALEGART